MISFVIFGGCPIWKLVFGISQLFCSRFYLYHVVVWTTVKSSLALQPNSLSKRSKHCFCLSVNTKWLFSRCSRNIRFCSLRKRIWWLSISMRASKNYLIKLVNVCIGISIFCKYSIFVLLTFSGFFYSKKGIGVVADKIVEMGNNG